MYGKKPIICIEEKVLRTGQDSEGYEMYGNKPIICIEGKVLRTGQDSERYETNQ